jgi:hypothetical protein
MIVTPITVLNTPSRKAKNGKGQKIRLNKIITMLNVKSPFDCGVNNRMKKYPTIHPIIK